ncbi:MAG: enoyl-CoA hydratase/isomerase family protein [Flavobacteriales bacterium]|nr:enoyl-CoA hydratase/isomerase family protein [Flavobacteriales bacterium]
MSYQNILTEKKGNAFIITINRENKLNALNIETLQEIKYAILSVQNDREVRGIILTGAGQKAFAAGADIAEFAEFNVKQGTQMSSDGHDVMNTIESSAIPVIAAVNGFSLGGGCELAMSCHIRVASENAKFGQPEVNLGLPPGYGGTQRLIQLIGKGKSTELLLTADLIKADEALSLGLVSKVVPIDTLMDTCKEYIQKISQKSPSAISKVISCINDHFKGTEAGFEKEISEFGLAFETSDFKEGTSAFLEKRSPNF